GRGLAACMPLCGSAVSSRNGGYTLSPRRTLWHRRNSDRDSGAPAAGADDLQGAADPDRSLVHRAQAQVSGKVPVGVEPDAVVSDLQIHRALMRLQADVDVPGAGVLHRVPEGLLSDPGQGLLALDGQFRLGVGD